LEVELISSKVTVQLTLGFCSDLVVATSNGKAGNEETTDWAWGLATMVGIYIAGGISGAHLNPAISIMLYIYRGFPLRKVPGYVLAQLLGAFLAGLIAFGLFQNDIIAYGGADLGKSGTMSAFITYPRYEWIDASTSFFTEFTGVRTLSEHIYPKFRVSRVIRHLSSIRTAMSQEI
jgi:aquaglyceroporin related protein